MTSACRPVGQLMSPYTIFSGSQGLITDEQNVVLALVFSEPVTGLAPTSFSVSGPSGATISGLKLFRGTTTFYHLVVNLPGTYYDSVTVSLAVSHVGAHTLSLGAIVYFCIACNIAMGWLKLGV